MNLDRRAFLAQAAATPLVFGLDDLHARPSPPPPDWFRRALGRMKETRRCGIVIVAPRDPKERRRLGEALRALTQSELPAVRQLLCEAVFIGMVPDLADGTVRSTGDGRNRYLLDSHGKVLAADSVSAETLERPRTFVGSFSSFLHGSAGTRLRERAVAIADEIPPNALQALSELDASDLETREEAYDTLKDKHLEGMIPYLAYFSRVARSSERRARARDLIHEFYKRSKEGAPGPRLPSGCGVGVEQVIGGCGGRRAGGIVVRCGLARVTKPSKKFLKFLTR